MACLSEAIRSGISRRVDGGAGAVLFSCLVEYAVLLTTPAGLVLAGLVAAELLGLTVAAYWLWRLHRRLRRLNRRIPSDLVERLARGEQAYNELVRLWAAGVDLPPRNSGAPSSASPPVAPRSAASAPRARANQRRGDG